MDHPVGDRQPVELGLGFIDRFDGAGEVRGRYVEFSGCERPRIPGQQVNLGVVARVDAVTVARTVRIGVVVTRPSTSL